SLNELVAEKLKINQEIDESELKRLIKLSTDGKLKMRAYEWSLNRPRSVRELRDYLRRKKVDEDQAEAIITDFTKRNYIDDKRFAQWLIELRRRGRKSERAISSELSSKGVAREISDELLNCDNNEEDRLSQIVAK